MRALGAPQAGIVVGSRAGDAAPDAWIGVARIDRGAAGVLPVRTPDHACCDTPVYPL